MESQARTLRDRLDQRYAELETIAERINESNGQVGQLQAAITGLEVQRLVLESELRAARESLNQQARSIYMHGHTQQMNELAEMMDGPEPLPRMQVAQRVLQSTANAVARVTERQRQLDEVVAGLRAQVAQAQGLADTLEAQRQELERQTAALTDELAGTDPRLRALMAQIDAEDEAARRRAYEEWVRLYGEVGLQSPSATALAAVRWALNQRGKPYRWGAEGPDSYDCSGLTQSAYAAVGIAIPRVSRQQFFAGPHVRFGNLIPGDLVFYAHDPHNPATIHHVAMYIGDGLIVHAPRTGDVVRVASVWRSGYAGAVRVVGGVPDLGPLPPEDDPSIPEPGGPTPPKPPPTTPPSGPPPSSPPGTSPGTTRPPATVPPTTQPPTTPPPATPPPTTSPPATTEPPTTAPPTTTSPPPTDPPTTEAPTTEAPATTETTQAPETTAG